MRRFTCWALILVAASAVSLGAVADAAKDSSAVKSRMEQRVRTLNELKAKGEVGEDSRGFAVLRGRDVDAGDVVAAENHDRRVIYAEGAKQTGASLEQVGRFWARKFAAESAKGAWLQRDNGDWYQK